MYQALVPGGGAACHAQGPSHHWSRLQCSGCTGAAGPASVPARLGAAWYGRVEAGTAARAGAGRKEEKLAPNCTHKVAPTNLDNHRLRGKRCLLRLSAEQAAPRRDQLTTATMHRSQSNSHPARTTLQLPLRPATGRQAGTPLPPQPSAHSR